MGKSASRVKSLDTCKWSLGRSVRCHQPATFLQVKAQQASANGNAPSGTSSKVKAGKAAGTQPSALVRAACLDHTTGVGIAVSHINEGKLAEAMEILDYIIGTTTGPQNTGAHIARGTARAMLRNLEGDRSLQLHAADVRLHACLLTE